MVALLYRLGVTCADMLSAAQGAGCDDLGGSGCASASRTKTNGVDRSTKEGVTLCRRKTNGRNMFRFAVSGALF